MEICRTRREGLGWPASFFVGVLLASAGCAGDGAQGPQGPQGQQGPTGATGAAGPAGPAGAAGSEGEAGSMGEKGDPGARGPAGLSIEDEPLSSMVALVLDPDNALGARSIPEYVKGLVERMSSGRPMPVRFPLNRAVTDSVRTIAGLEHHVVVRWLDPLDLERPSEIFFGANNDYIAYFGEGWEADGATPYFSGSATEGWVWINHEYISNEQPTETTAPTGQNLTLAKWLSANGLLTKDDIEADVWSVEDVDAFIRGAKRNVGGSWFRIVQDPGSRRWSVDLTAGSLRYDATSATLTKVVGHALARRAMNDEGVELPEGVVPGIAGDCSGAVTPWGTILSAEENVQDYYGDLETAWSSDNKFDPSDVAWAPGSNVQPDVSPSTSASFGAISVAAERHDRDNYGFLVEMDVGAAPDEYYGKTEEGVGHRKIGAMGRARWENATFVVDTDWRLAPEQPVVVYAANDRYSGRIYKFVSRETYKDGMSKAEMRALLDEGTLYVAHFADLDNARGFGLSSGVTPTMDAPGSGRWIEMSVTNETDIAPNAGALQAPAAPTMTVGAALKDTTWNGIAGFPTDNAVRQALFTAATKIGVRETNRPEDVEWSPTHRRLYVAFTKHNRRTALDDSGILRDPATHGDSPRRDDVVGRIYAMEETNDDPATARTFLFWEAWAGSSGDDDQDPDLEAANPDNLVLDAHGDVWFGTDGNFGTNNHADALYYLDLDPTHRAGQEGVERPTFAFAFRVAAGPSDSEATGPAFNADQSTLFFDVQHPGESTVSHWPHR
ncbi:MAG: DUF839 domain-containing protein [Deltaproteobacteria bacterium]|nr:DUF839 domain-containing protein [Deltaproteobacteria bacterium]